MLLCMHALVCTVKVHALYFGDYWWDKQTMMMLAVVGMQIWICSYWLYNAEREDKVLTKR